MKRNVHIQTWLLAVLLIGWGCLIASCSDHTDGIENGQDSQPSVPLQVASLTRTAGDEADVDTPDPFKGMSIQLFLIPQNKEVAGETTLKGKAIYSDASSPWYSTIKVTATGEYKVFGFMPAEVSIDEANDGVALSGSTEDAEKEATLTVNQMKTVSDLDVCVVTGVRGGMLGENEHVLPSLFDYTAEEIEGHGYGVSLLADHIYAAAEFRFKLVEENINHYNKLRTIKLKQVILKNAKKAVKTTIKLAVRTTGNGIPNPISEITMADAEVSGTAEATLFTSAQGETLKTTDADVITVTGYFVPGNSADLIVESVYDVYDKSGQLLRENSHAVNKIGSLVGSLERGKKKIIKMTVNPTYLYVLSDNDPDVFSVTAGD